MKLVAWVLRVVVFGTFLGHGIFALLGNEHWMPYLGVVGITGEGAYQVMFVIGIIDLIVAVSMLLRPSKVVVAYACTWAFATALARPLSGESWLEFLERAANWGAPMALYLVLYWKNHKIDQ
jgi:hypothetical protein